MGEPGQGGAAGILQGVRVVEAGGRLAAPVLGVLLAEQGAEVLRVVPPEPPADPVLQAILSRGKTEVPLDLATAAGREALGRLLAGADLALTDLGPAARAAAGLDFEGARARNPGLITCAIPAFPGGDPRADEDVPDAVAGAAGCLYERMLGAPRFHELPVPSVLAALFAGSGVAAALRARLRDGRGQHVEASLRGSSLFAQILLLFMKLGVPRGFVPLKLVATPFMRSWRCRDGRWAYLHITLPSHNAKMLEVLEAAGLGHHAKALRAVLSEETRRDPSQVGSIGEAKRIVRVLTTIFRERTADEWEATLGRELCCIKVRTVEEWLRDSDAAGMSDAAAVEDPVLGTLVTPGPGISCPEQPPVSSPRRIAADLPSLLARWAVPAAPRSALPPPGAPEDRRPPLAGVRVADLSRIIAGPCGARVLAELGAEVTSFQSPGALDWALSFHLMFNAGKRSITVDTAGPEGRETLAALLQDLRPDAVLQNYRHLDVARALGVGPEALRARFPGLIYAHLNAYGDQGAWRDRPGFEQVVQAVSGIQTSYGGGVPRLLPTPVIDIGSGLAGAFATVLGLYHRERTGQGVFVTTHLTWVAVLFQVLEVAAVQAGLAAAAGVATEPGETPLAALVRTRGGHAVLAGTRGDVETWLRHMGLSREAGPPAVVSGAVRSLRLRPVAWWRRSLAEAGVGDRVYLEPLARARRLLRDAPWVLAAPIPLLRRRDYPGCPMPLASLASPFRLSRTPLVDIAPPPLRGTDTAAAFARIGRTVPGGSGVSPYPKDRPFLIWAVGLVRWGYFAWRSGSV